MCVSGCEACVLLVLLAKRSEIDLLLKPRGDALLDHLMGQETSKWAHK